MSSTSVMISLFCASLGGLGIAQTSGTKQEAVPNISAGPDLEADARPVEAPIAAVTVFSDRARIRRKAEAAIPAGITALRLPDLPGATLLETVRVSVQNAKLLRVEAAPIQREQISIGAVEGALENLEKQTDRRAAIDAQIRAYSEELSFLAEVLPKAPVAEKDRGGKALPAISLEAWRVVLDFLTERRSTVRARVRGLEEERRKVEEEIAALRRHVALRDLGAFTSQTVRVLAIVEARGPAKAGLTVEYFIPGASWLPAYELHYFAKDATVEIATYGLVTQATGEDWNDVELSLSTAIPGQGITMPELLTWTLGEKSELIPRPIAVAQVGAPPAFPPPTPSVTRKEQELAAKIESLHARLALLDETIAGGQIGIGDSFGHGAGAEARAKAEEEKRASEQNRAAEAQKKQAEKLRRAQRDRMKNVPSARVEAPPAAPPPMPMDEAMIEGERSSATGSTFSSVVQTVGGVLGSSGESYAHTSLALFEQDRSGVPAFADANLPAMLAGGLDYVYPAAAKFTVPAQASRLRVPLAVERYPVSVYYEATPSLAKTAYLRAAVENKGERPLLRGPVSIFVGDTFTGEGLLQTTGPGGKIELPLGADEDIRLVRTVKPSTRSEGVFSKSDVTVYTTDIEVGNYKKRPIRILIVDQVPKSGHEDVEIKLSSTNPAPKDPPNADGLMRFELNIPPGETRKISFAYSVKRPADWQLQQY